MADEQQEMKTLDQQINEAAERVLAAESGGSDEGGEETPVEEAAEEEVSAESGADAGEEVEPELKYSWDIITQKEEKIRNREKKLAEQEKKYKAMQERQEYLDTLKKTDRIKWLKEQGIDHEEIVYDVIGEEDLPAEDKQKREIESLKKELNELRNGLTEKQKQEQEQISQKQIQEAAKEYQDNVYEVIDNSEELGYLREWEEISGINVGDVALNVLADFYAKNDVSLTPEQVIGIINEDIGARWKKKMSKPTEPKKTKEAKESLPAKKDFGITNELREEPSGELFSNDDDWYTKLDKASKVI